MISTHRHWQFRPRRRRPSRAQRTTCLSTSARAYKYKGFRLHVPRKASSWASSSRLQLHHHAAHHRCVPQASPLPHRQGNLHARLLLPRRDQSCGAFVGSARRGLRQAPVDAQGSTLDAVHRETVGKLHIPVRAPPKAREAGACLLARNLPRARDGKSYRSPRSTCAPSNRNLGIVLSKFTEKDEKPRSTFGVLRCPPVPSAASAATPAPTTIITIIEGARPAELGCTQCLACLHRCPVNASSAW